MTRNLKKCWPFLFLAIVALLNIALQARFNGVLIGSDAIFHFNRFYDAAEQIKSGNFSLFATNYGFSQSGRIVNGVYGPIFAYLNGALLLILHSWFAYELVTSFIVYWLGASGMYCLSRKIGANRFSAIAISICYMTAGWLPRWQVAQNMTAWGAALMPFMLLSGIRMIQNHKEPIKIIPLALSVSILIQIHLLSAVMLIMALAVFFLLGIKKAENPKKMILQTVKGAMLTILLSANVFGNLLEVFTKNNLAFPVKFDTWRHTLVLTTLGSGRGQLNIFVFILFIISICIAWHIKDSLLSEVEFVGLSFLLLSSGIVPWKFLQALVPELGYKFQFPSRLTVIAYPLLYSVLAVIGSRISKQKLSKIVLMTLAIFSLGINLRRLNHQINHQRIYLTNTEYVIVTGTTNQIIKSYHSRNLNSLLQCFTKRSPDYLPNYSSSKNNISQTYEKNILKTNFSGEKFVDENGKLLLCWKNKYDRKIKLPIITYKQTRLVLDGHLIKPKVNRIGVPTIYSLAGYHEVEVYFVSSWWLPLFWLTSLWSWSLVIIRSLKRRYEPKGKNINKNNPTFLVKKFKLNKELLK